jgi:hypothetical protein
MILLLLLYGCGGGNDDDVTVLVGCRHYFLYLHLLSPLHTVSEAPMHKSSVIDLSRTSTNRTAPTSIVLEHRDL